MTIKLLKNTHCCGLQELTSLGAYSGCENTITRVIKDKIQGSWNGAFIYFTDISYFTGSSRGIRLTKYIKKHKLGRVFITGEIKNTNSGNMLTVFNWAYDKDALEKWFKNNASDRDKKAVKEYLNFRYDGNGNNQIDL